MSKQIEEIVSEPKNTTIKIKYDVDKMKENLADAFDAINMVKDFETEILYRHRYLFKHALLEKIKPILSQLLFEISPNSTFYRARIYNVTNDNKKLNLIESVREHGNSQTEAMMDLIKELRKEVPEPFNGFNAKDSFVNTVINQIPGGRANPNYIPCLYVAESPYTAMVEVQPTLRSKISIAKINVTNKLLVLDLTKNLSTLKGTDWHLIKNLGALYSKNANGDANNYIVTQALTEFILTQDFQGRQVDGIRYTSSLDKKGVNLAVFNFEKCEVVSSKLYKLAETRYFANPVYDDEPQLCPNNRIF